MGIEALENKIKDRLENHSSPELIYCYSNGEKSKSEILQEMSNKICNYLGNNDLCKTLYEAVMARENIEQTGIGEGLGLPHARIDGVSKVIISVALLEKEVEYGSIDNKKVKLIVMVVAPKEATKEYLTVISNVANLFKSVEYRNFIFKAKNSEELLNSIKEFK